MFHGLAMRVRSAKFFEMDESSQVSPSSSDDEVVGAGADDGPAMGCVGGSRARVERRVRFRGLLEMLCMLEPAAEMALSVRVSGWSLRLRGMVVGG